MTTLWRIVMAGVIAITSSAQQGKTEVTGFAGYAKTYDDEGSLGGGATAGFTASYRFRPSLSAEFEYARFQHRRDVANVFVFSGSGNWFTGNVLKHWAVNSRFQPYVTGGFGALNYEGSFTSPAMAFGAGAKGFVTRNLFIRPEFKVLVSVFSSGGRTAEPPLSNMRLTIGAGWQF